MRALVTGATGKVGHAVARALAERGDEVRGAGARPGQGRGRAARRRRAGASATSPILPRWSAAVAGCEIVFNAMGLPEQWVRDESIFDRVNARGHARASRRPRARAGVRRLVHTSTEDVFHAERGGRFDESQVADYPKGTAYERSKQRAEELALAARDGLEVVIVNPSGVYGPGPSASVSFDKGMFEPLVKRRLPALPPGGLGLVFTEGLAAGPPAGGRQAGATASATSCATRTCRCATLPRRSCGWPGRGWVPPTLPMPAARALAAGSEALSRVIGRPPLLSRGQLYFFTWNAAPDSTKAQTELGWQHDAARGGDPAHARRAGAVTTGTNSPCVRNRLPAPSWTRIAPSSQIARRFSFTAPGTSASTVVSSWQVEPIVVSAVGRARDREATG